MPSLTNYLFILYSLQAQLLEDDSTLWRERNNRSLEDCEMTVAELRPSSLIPFSIGWVLLIVLMFLIFMTFFFMGLCVSLVHFLYTWVSPLVLMNFEYITKKKKNSNECIPLHIVLTKAV
jgi:hypothetical protein